MLRAKYLFVILFGAISSQEHRVNAHQDCVDVLATCSSSPARFCHDEQTRALMMFLCPRFCNFCRPEPELTNTSWTPCSRSCGRGVRQRRICDEDGRCTFVHEFCEQQVCPRSVSSWSSCSRTCGWGTRHRTLCDGGDAACSVEYEDCRVEICPERSCISPLINHYGDRSHDCCNASSVRLSSCGVGLHRSRRVANGRDAPITRWPWTTQLIQNGFPFCAGSLISREYVLTAAHCVTRSVLKNGTLVLKFGAHLLQDSSRFILLRTATEILIHPDFREDDIANDIAIVKFSRLQSLSSRYRPICLPQGEQVPDDLACVIAGWGVDETGLPPINLQEASVRILPSGVCVNAFSTTRGLLNNVSRLVCAGRILGDISSCQGDSGGPLMCQRCSTCPWMLVGITSLGSRCNRFSPGLYTRVSRFESWINTRTNSTIESASIPSCN